MKHEAKSQFADGGTSAQPPSVFDIISTAKSAVHSMTGLNVDSVASCRRQEDLTWTVIIDVIESLARMGDNDLLASYEVQLSGKAELLAFTRLRRYHREDGDH